MAHGEQLWFFNNCKHFFPHYFDGKNALEIGSLNINGTVRVFFNGGHYTGIDIGPGPCVDVVCPGEDFSAKACTFDMVMSTEVFEHAINWDLLFINMLRLVKRDGLIVFTCASYGRQQHGTRLFLEGDAPHVAGSTDYYRNLGEEDFTRLINFDAWFSNYIFVEDNGGLYFAGLMPGASQYAQNMEVMKSGYKKYLYNRRVLGLPHEYILANNLL